MPPYYLHGACDHHTTSGIGHQRGTGHQAYDAELAAYDREYEERCGCICDQRNPEGERVQYASCCVANPSADTCTNGPEVCRDLTVCDTAFEFEAAAPKATRDRVCQRLTACGPTAYESVAPTATTDRECTPLSPPCPLRQWEEVPEVYLTDRVCRDPQLCPAKTYQAAPHTATSDAVCRPVTQCGSDEYEVAPPTS